jgi:trimethylamine--corrinoid protein Co-methyltransferase
MSQLQLRLLTEQDVERIIAEAYELLQDPGVRIYDHEVLDMVGQAGAEVDRSARVARIPAAMVDQALKTVPHSFYLHDVEGWPAVHYGGDDVHFDPGSAAIYTLDYGNLHSRKPATADLVNHLRLADVLPQLNAVSTALVCADVPREVADMYRLYIALRLAHKPVVTGAFAIETFAPMHALLVTLAGSEQALREKPRAVFDVCPSPPLLWSDITCRNMVDCARTGVPAELVSMPLTGATGPANLAGAVVQHAAESLSGIVIHQLAGPGAPIVWGGSPAAFDMRTGTPPMGAIETMMIDMAYAQVGKALSLPTHAYMGMSDAKIVDTQVGLESGMGALLAALGGINMISGAGMLDFESCQSLEKLVIDNEIIAMVRRFLRGVDTSGESLGLEIIRQVGHRGNFLVAQHTLRHFQREVYQPSPVIDRDFRQTWETKGARDAGFRAHERVHELIGTHEMPNLDTRLLIELEQIMLAAGRPHGLEHLPKWD